MCIVNAIQNFLAPFDLDCIAPLNTRGEKRIRDNEENGNLEFRVRQIIYRIA